jgi:protein HOOK3
MSTHSQEIEHAVLTWISSFEDLTHKTDNIESLADGVVLTEIMHKIEPNVFNLSKINPEHADNWALRLNNLSFLYEGLEHFYVSVLSKPFDKAYVDIVKVSKNDDREGVFNLVELVIGAAVRCHDREYYINKIMSLDDICQNALMQLIEKILNKWDSENGPADNETSGSFENALGRHSSTMTNSAAAKAQVTDKNLLIKLEELENENQNLNLKVTELAHEKEISGHRAQELMKELDRKNQEIKSIIQEREEIQEKLSAQESIEDMKNELKLKDLKYEQLEQFIEELKGKQDEELKRLEEEVEKQKRKVASLTKVEGTVDFYKEKYEEYSRLTIRMTEVEEELERHKKKVEELTKTNEVTQTKMNTFKEKLEAEKTANISLDIELTKKNTEINALKNEKKKLEATNTELETKIHDQNRIIEKQIREREDSVRHYGGTEKAMNELAGFEREDENAEKSEHTAAVSEGEKEILQSENAILKAKCKEIQIENEKLKVTRNSDTEALEKLIHENNTLKEEIDKVRSGSPSGRSRGNAGSSDDSEIMRETINQKTMLISQLNEEIVELKNSGSKTKKLEEQLSKKEEEIRSLKDDLETMNSIIVESKDQKEDELKLASAALQELAVRYIEVEKQLLALRGDGDIKPTHSSSASVSNKPRK